MPVAAFKRETIVRTWPRVAASAPVTSETGALSDPFLNLFSAPAELSGWLEEKTRAALSSPSKVVGAASRNRCAEKKAESSAPLLGAIAPPPKIGATVGMSAVETVPSRHCGGCEHSGPLWSLEPQNQQT